MEPKKKGIMSDDLTKKEAKPDPFWKDLYVRTRLPLEIEGLSELTRNLWWCWNTEAGELFEMIDTDFRQSYKSNPIPMLENLTDGQLSELAVNNSFLVKYNEVYSTFKSYMRQFGRRGDFKVAYFSMEYGLWDSLKIFSGGLGILAGDYLKEASDSAVDMVAVGLLYRTGYFEQKFTSSGEQLAIYQHHDFANMPIEPVYEQDSGERVTISIAFPGRTLYARVWRVNVGRIPLYLLDTDFDMNSSEDKWLTHHLYGGDEEHRFMQEMLLGVGGMRLLEALEAQPDIYHCNEGHAAFIGVERLRKLINEDRLTFEEAVEVVRSSSLFTTHTPVPAGHDTFSEKLMKKYVSHYPHRKNITWKQFMSLGKPHKNDENEKFSMSYLAVSLSQEVNGVSKLHGKVTREMFCELWPGYYPQDLYIGHVTNGVHYPTWVAANMKRLYKKTFGEDFLADQSNEKHWEKIHDVADEKIDKLRKENKKKLIDYIAAKCPDVELKMAEDMLIIGFARRFATYKRAQLLFADKERLATLVNDSARPVRFVFAGKAHPRDRGGKDLIKYVINMSKEAEFAGKIVFLENYNIDMAQKLVQGVDVWLNNPTRPLEASGTSGMKAVMNGGLHFSVLDGWWVEGYQPGRGWALPLERTFENQDLQDNLDAETIYQLLEEEVVPLFYQKNQDGISPSWLQYVKNSIAYVAPMFTTKRMIDDYIDSFYSKMSLRSAAVRFDGYEMATDIVEWKKMIKKHWHDLKVVSLKLPELLHGKLEKGRVYQLELELELGDLHHGDIGVEVVVGRLLIDGKLEIVGCKQFYPVEGEKNRSLYKVEFQTEKAGELKLGIRIFPQNEILAHRQDLPLVRWIRG